MIHNPNKYDQALQSLSMSVFKSSSVFADKVEELKSRKERYNELLKERDELLKERENLMNIEETNQAIEKKKINSIERYEQMKNHLRDSILKEASLAIKHQKTPLIFSDISSEYLTSNIEKARHQVRLLKIKSEIVKNIDKLYKLAKNAYCLDDSDDDAGIRQLFDEYNLESLYPEFEFLQTSNIEQANSTRDKSQYIQEEIIEGKYKLSPEQLFKSSILNITEQIQNLDKQSDSQSETTFDISQIDHLTLPNTNSVLHPLINHLISQDQLIDEQKFDSLLSENATLIDGMTQEVSKLPILSSIPDHCQFSQYIDVLTDIREQIINTQNQIDQLNSAVSTNRPISQIWERAGRLRERMATLARKIIELNKQISRKITIPSIGPIGYPKSEETVPVYILSPSQIGKCRALISEFKEVVDNLEKYDFEFVDLQETINKVQELISEYEKAESITENNSRTMSRSNSNIFSEDEQITKIKHQHQELIDDQNEKVTQAIDALSTIDDSLKSVNFNESEIEPRHIEMPSISLYSVDDEPSEDNTYQPSSNLEEILEENERLIEQLEARSDTDNSELIKSILQQIEQEERLTREAENLADNQSFINSEAGGDPEDSKLQVKLLRNEEIEDLIDEFLEKFNSSTSSDYSHSQGNTYEELTAHITDLENKIRSVVVQQDELMDMRKEKEERLKILQAQINESTGKINARSTHDYQKRLLNSIESNKMKIEQLRQQYEEKCNEEKYQTYLSLCEKIEETQKNIDSAKQ